MGARPVIGYTRVSTEEQAESGAGLAAQRAAIGAEAERRDWSVQWIEDAGYSAKNLRRPGIEDALAALRASQADALVISRLDRLSRSWLDFTGLMETARREGWALVALDLGVDTSTPNGEMMAKVMASFAPFERKLIGQRTREALAQRRAAGVRLGRPRGTPDPVIKRIEAERECGKSLRAIADGLNAEAVPAVRGGLMWRPSTVQAALRSAQIVGTTDVRSA